VRRLGRWTDEEIEHFVADSLMLRYFRRVYPQLVPGDTTLLQWAHLIGVETPTVINHCVLALARSLWMTRGRELQVDSMAVEMS
jgi:hypothetical protein